MNPIFGQISFTKKKQIVRKYPNVYDSERCSCLELISYFRYLGESQIQISSKRNRCPYNETWYVGSLPLYE